MKMLQAAHHEMEESGGLEALVEVQLQSEEKAIIEASSDSHRPQPSPSDPNGRANEGAECIPANERVEQVPFLELSGVVDASGMAEMDDEQLSAEQGALLKDVVGLLGKVQYCTVVESFLVLQHLTLQWPQSPG